VSLLDWFKPKAYTLKDPEFAHQVNPLFTGSGVSVTPDNAMKISAVYGCVRILSETVSSLPLHIYQKTGTGRELARHPLNDLLGVSSNGEQTAMEMREFQMSSLCLRGNSYSAISRSNRGGVGAITPLKPAFCRLDRDGSGRLVVDYQEPGNNKTYTGSQIWRVAGMGSDGVTGLSPVALARENMGIAITTEQSAARVFSNGAQTATTLEFDHALSEDQLKRLRDQWEDNYSGYKNHHKPMILESGMKANAIGMNMTDAQFLESRKFQIAEIARWYRVPLHMLNELDKATFSNIEHQSIEFVIHTIRPWLVRLEQTISRDLLTPSERAAGLYASHKVEGLLRGDTKSRYEAYASGITN
jgi:HK97 family phage portal protein